MLKHTLNNYFGGFKRNNDRSSQLTVVSIHIDISYSWEQFFRLFPECLFSMFPECLFLSEIYLKQQ